MGDKGSGGGEEYKASLYPTYQGRGVKGGEVEYKAPLGIISFLPEFHVKLVKRIWIQINTFILIKLFRKRRVKCDDILSK